MGARRNKSNDMVEAEIQKDLEKEFALLVVGLEKTHTLFRSILETRSETRELIPLATAVGEQILVKIYDDSRSAYLLGFRGYPMQTASLTASLYESAFMLCYVADDEDLAKKWILHQDEKRLFISVRELTKLGLQRIADDDIDALAEKDYRSYQELCMAKHGNPVLQRLQGWEETNNEFSLIFGAKNGKLSQQLTWFSIARAIRYSTMACTAFLRYHVPKVFWNRILFLRDDCLKQLKKIDEEGLRRGKDAWPVLRRLLEGK